LYFDGGLWSLAGYAASRALVAWPWLVIAYPLTSRDAPPYPVRRWIAEIWPFQWRIGLSSLAGYLAFRAFSPIVFLEQGAAAAGQFGLAIALMNVLISVSTAWPFSQTARYAAMYAAKRYGELQHEFPRMLWGSTVVAALAAAASIAALWQARQMGIGFAMKLPEPATTAVVLAAAVVHHFVIAYAVFLRAEGREPMLVPSVAGGIITVSAVLLAARFGTLLDIAVVNLLCAMIGVPIVLVLFRAHRKYHLAHA
jgi:hypothetical protein